jgi:hypothetical protein
MFEVMNQRVLQKNFNQLKRFIEACLGNPLPVDEEDKQYLTADRQSLMALIKRLSQLIDEEAGQIQVPAFESWPLPVPIDYPETDKQKAIIDKFNALEKRRYDAYLQSRTEFESLTSELRAELRNRHKTVADLIKAVEINFSGQSLGKVGRLSWVLLPESEEGHFPHIVKHYRQLEEQNPQIKYEVERLHKVHSLKADHIYVGMEEFEGYVVFYFASIKSAILECPIQNNAIYVFHNDWQKLSRLSKSELLSQHSHSVQRIIHTGDWFSRLEWLIESRRAFVNKEANETTRQEPG